MIIPNKIFQIIKQFVLDRKDDIEQNMEDFGDLKEVLEWIKNNG